MRPLRKTGQTMIAALLALAGTLQILGADASTAPAAATPALDTGAFAPIPVDLYDPNPNHLWNRLHSVLFVRKDTQGMIVGVDEIDPPVGSNSTYLFNPSRLRQAQAVLAEFLAHDGAKLIRDPVKRAFLQHDLWMLFDCLELANNSVIGINPKAPEKGLITSADMEGLRLAVVQVMRAVALTSDEVKNLPDNLAQAMTAGIIPRTTNPSDPLAAYFTTDIRRNDSAWVGIEAQGAPITPVLHVGATGGRYAFAILLRLPGGRVSTVSYLERIRGFPGNQVNRAVRDDPQASRGTGERPPSAAPLKFPVGTRFAILRQMMVIDNEGHLVGTPLTVSVQLRSFGPDWQQNYTEYYTPRRPLFAGKSGGLVMRGPKEMTYDDVFAKNDGDPLEARLRARNPVPILQSCISCHHEPNVLSFMTFSAVLPESAQLAARSSPLPDFQRLAAFKSQQASWITLGAYWPNLYPVPRIILPARGGR